MRLVGLAEHVGIRAFNIEVSTLLVQYIQKRASTKVVGLSDNDKIVPREGGHIGTV